MQEVTRKLAVLEKKLKEQRNTIFSEELDNMLPKVDIDAMLDEVPHRYDTSDSESENSSDDEPFYSSINNHKLHDNGSYRFLCQDEKGTTIIWCDYQNALTNVGRKVMREYVKANSLEKNRYLPKGEKPRKKSDTRKSVNKKKLQSMEEVIITKVINRKKIKDGFMFKVLMSDMTSAWLKKDELEDHDHLIEEYETQLKEKEGLKRMTAEARKQGKEKVLSEKRAEARKQGKERVLSEKRAEARKQGKEKVLFEKRTNSKRARTSDVPINKSRSQKKKKTETATKKQKSKMSQEKKKTEVAAKKQMSKTSKAQEKKKTETAAKKQKSKTSKAQENKKKETATSNHKKESVFICKLHHLSFDTFKAEGNKKWFSVNQRFGGVKCHKCRVSISDSPNDNCFVPKNSSPAYICINSIKGCMKCLCNKCCIDITMKGTETATKRSTRSQRKN